MFLLVVVQTFSSVRILKIRSTPAHHIPYPLRSPEACSNLSPLSWWCHPTMLSSVVPFSSCLLSFSVSGSFPKSWAFASGGQSIGASASASVFPMNTRVDFFLGLTGLTPCSPTDSQESSPELLCKSISTLVLSLLYGPTLTSIHDYWKNHSFDYMDLCWQSHVSAF